VFRTLSRLHVKHRLPRPVSFRVSDISSGAGRAQVPVEDGRHRTTLPSSSAVISAAGIILMGREPALRGRKFFVGGRQVMHGQNHLLQIILALNSGRSLADLLDGRQKQANEDG